jgi:hypothetical protein
MAKEIAIPVQMRCSNNAILKDCVGIFDTGATGSMISENVAKELSLIPCGNITVSGVHGTENANLYKLDIIFGGKYILPDHTVSGAGNDAGFDLLIGMDIIAMGNLTIFRENGKTFFTFYLPDISI